MLGRRGRGRAGGGNYLNQAYVKQQDVFYSQLTVRETLLMAARLRLPRDMPLREKTKMVDDLINKLGLLKVQYSTVQSSYE